MPACAIRASSPTVFSVTVLPPVFGPVMTSSRRSPSSSMLMGTTWPPLAFRFRSSSGWRALWSKISQLAFETIRLRLLARWDGECVRPYTAHFHAVVVFGEAGFGELQFKFGQDIDCRRGLRSALSPIRRVISSRMR